MTWGNIFSINAFPMLNLHLNHTEKGSLLLAVVLEAMTVMVRYFNPLKSHPVRIM